MERKADKFDTNIKIITPENIAFEYQVAGPFRRLCAYVVDWLIRGCVAVVAMLVLTLSFGVIGLGPGVGLVLWFLLSWFYGGLFEAYWNGQTPGKRVMQIRVMSVDGQSINGLQAVLRNVLRTVDALPVGYLLGLIVCAMNDRFQRLGDIPCGTIVVIEQRQWYHGVLRITDVETSRIVDLIPANFQANRSMARALATYVRRRGTFAWPRRMEIARYLGEPLRKKFNLPPETNLDLLLCGLYHRTFVTDNHDEPAAAGSPLRQPLESAETTVAIAAARADWGGEGT